MNDSLSFLSGGGEAERMIRERDWSSHPMGPPERWPECFRVALSLVLNSPESMILSWGSDLHFFFNEAYFPLLGPRLPWAMGERFDKVWADAWRQAKPIIDDALAGRAERFIDLPWKLDTDRGSADTWWTFSYSRVLDGRGAVAGLFIFTNETTARVLGDAALRESEERLRLVVEGAKDHAILTTDPDGIITTWSAGAEATFEWQASEVVGQSFAVIFTPEDRAAGMHRGELSKAELKGSAKDERWHLTKSGRRVFMNGSVHPLPVDAQGRKRGFLKIARNETERREAEEALRTSEGVARENIQRVQMALAAGAIIGTWFWDLPTDRFTVDEAFAVNFGLDPTLGRNGLSLAQVVETVHPDDQAGLADAINEAVARGGRYAHQYRVRRADGKYYWLEANGHVEHAPDGTPLRFPGVLIDVEERRALVEERDRALRQLRELNETLEHRVAERTEALLQSEEALRQSQKMEAVGQLTGGLAHDFNNLLAGISGSLELMQNRQRQGRLSDVDRYMTAAQGAAKRAAALTHRLLAFSRRQTLTPTPTDVNRLVEGMQELIQRTVGPGIKIDTVEAPDLWSALVDASQLENALLNLCINARDAMPDGGRITIETTNRTLEERTARQHNMPEGEYLVLSVSDTGAGMPPEVVARAFEPFFTTKPIGEGTGLGLSMIYGFAQQSGGQVRIHSEVGRGTSISIYLPRHYGEGVQAEQAAKPPQQARDERGATVLVVDDEPTVRMLVVDILDDLGYTAIEAADSAAGLTILLSSVSIDLLVTDVGLPGGMNGRQMADAARVNRPDLNVLFITGYAENAVLGHDHLASGMAVMTKPFSVDAMATRIGAMIEAHRAAERRHSG